MMKANLHDNIEYVAHIKKYKTWISFEKIAQNY